MTQIDSSVPAAIRVATLRPSIRRVFQIEVTTVCNFRCFYCIGRTWQGRHMEMELFDAILGRLPHGRHVVSLQGEGEPLAHPRFWEMTENVVRLGFTPYTITNGSLIDPARIEPLFPSIGVSLDTLDPVEAERIGRRQFTRVLERFDALYRRVGPRRINVHSVDFGQNLEPLRVFLKQRGIKRHIVQPLQAKADYRKLYPGWNLAKNSRHGACRNLVEAATRYFNIDGVSLPCCFIKDVSGYRSDDHLRAEFAASRIPTVCVGCREIGGGRHE